MRTDQKIARVRVAIPWPAFSVLLLSVAGPLAAAAAAAYDITAGSAHTCAIDDNGVTCWGDNSVGQTEVPPGGLVNPSVVSAGDWTTCAIDDNGVTCWGWDFFGQATPPVGLVNPIDVSVGEGAHVCAIDDNGATCWGKDEYGKATVPPGLVNPTAITAGVYHTCAIDDNGVTCWGDNSADQTEVPLGLVNPKAIAAGGYHTCVIDDNGVTCWGLNPVGTTQPPALINPRAITGGYNYACAIDDNGVTCWGWDAYGRATVPPGLVNPTAITAGVYHTCAIDDNGATCWGNDDSGQSTVPAGLSFSLLPFIPKSGPTTRPEPFECQPGSIVPAATSGVDGLVLVTHGWTLPGFPPWWVDTMATEIGFRLVENGVASEWNVAACWWTDESERLLPNGLKAEAERIGERLGEYLAAQSYTRFHFIGHSAGSWLVQSIVNRLDEDPDPVTIHTTFLDAYVPITAQGDQLGESSNSHWAEHYVDRYTAPYAPEWVSMADRQLPGAYNLDLTGLSPSGDPFARHSFPHEWYFDTVVNPTAPEAQGWGFLRSQELGALPPHTHGGESLGPGPTWRRSTLEFYFDAVELLAAPTISQGIVNAVIGGIRLLSSSPAWLVSNVSVPQSFNALSLDYEFISDAEGWLSVQFLGQELVASDERYSPTGVNSKTIFLDQTYAPGTYPLAFRLDPYTAVQSEVRITNVRFGLITSSILVDFVGPGLVAGYGPDPDFPGTPKGTANLITEFEAGGFLLSQQADGVNYVTDETFLGYPTSPPEGHLLAVDTLTGAGTTLTLTFTDPAGSGLPAFADASTVSVFVADADATPSPRVVVTSFDVNGNVLEVLQLTTDSETLTFSIGQIARIEFFDNGGNGFAIGALSFGQLTVLAPSVPTFSPPGLVVLTLALLSFAGWSLRRGTRTTRS